MKANKATKIALATVCCAAIMSVGSVFGADTSSTGGGETVYPDDFEQTLEISPLSDYAVYNDTYAFISNNKITFLYTDTNNERKSRAFSPDVSGEITQLDYGENGELYFKTSTDYSYLYEVNLSAATDAEPVRQTHDFQNKDNSLLLVENTVFYTLSNEGKLNYWNNGSCTEVGAESDVFSLLKRYGNEVFVIKNGNKPHKLSGATATPVDMTYTNFELTEIFSGDTAEKLKANNYQVKTGAIKQGAYFTKLKDDKIDDVFRTDGTQKADANKPCIILCTSGNATVFATNDGMFITATENVTESLYNRPNNDWSAAYAYSITDVGVYASPYMCESTKIATLSSGSENRVEVIERFESEYIRTKFYRVRYTVKNGDGVDEIITGFVAANLLTPYDFAAEDNPPEEKGDGKFSYDNNVVSVVLTVVIVGLVLVAIMYISLIGTKKNKDKKAKKLKDKRDPDDDGEE